MDVRDKIEMVGLTDAGMVRSNNEDSIGVWPELGAAVLADGMGGYKGGEVASGITVNVIRERLADQLAAIKTPGEVAAEDDGRYTHESQAARESIEVANATVLATAQSQPQFHKMGTTVVVVVFYDNRLTMAHVGDSRLYRVRAGEMEQLTRDHSLLQELVDRGFYTLEEAKASLNKNVVTRALGIESAVAVEMNEDVALRDDVYLLCSDGLSDMVEDAQIASIIASHTDDLATAARRLVELANSNGGKDNISVILAKVVKDFTAKRAWYEKVMDWLFE